MRRRAARCIVHLCDAGAILLLAAVAAGTILRDRWLLTAFCFYLPALPLMIGVVLYGGLRCIQSTGHRRRLHLVMTAGALILALATVHVMWRWPAPTDHAPDGDPAAAHIALCQWNVQWGGGRNSSPAAWQSIAQQIVSLHPDLVVLSEAPDALRVGELQAQLGPTWSHDIFEHERSASYWYRLSVLSRWPSEVEGRHRFKQAAAMVVRVDAPTGPVRVMVVDIVSDPAVHRPPVLQQVHALRARYAAQGDPIDILAGDFNTPAHSVAFDALRSEAAGYERVAELIGGWQGTFPSRLPLWAIDHVWIHASLTAHSSELIANANTNHLGQMIRLKPGSP